MINDGEFEYVYAANRVPIAQVNLETNEVQYLHSDFIGSVIAVTDDNSDLEAKLNYGAYGKRIGANVTRFGFAGEWVDTDTGYSYNRARWYDSSTAHFLSKDPLVQSTQEAYGYSGGNPLTRVDPSGADWSLNWRDWNCADERDFNWSSSSCLSWMDTKEAKVATNASAGIGDVLLAGFGQDIREAFGMGNVIDTCSTEYTVSSGTTEIATFFLAPVKATKTVGISIKFAKNSKPKNKLQDIIDIVDSPQTYHSGISTPDFIKKYMGSSDFANETTKGIAKMQAFKKMVKDGQDIPGLGKLKHIGKGSAKQKGGGYRDRYQAKDGTIYESDTQHGTLEAYDKRGNHKGEFDIDGSETKVVNNSRKLK